MPENLEKELNAKESEMLKSKSYFRLAMFSLGFILITSSHTSTAQNFFYSNDQNKGSVDLFIGHWEFDGNAVIKIQYEESARAPVSLAAPDNEMWTSVISDVEYTPDNVINYSITSVLNSNEFHPFNGVRVEAELSIDETGSLIQKIQMPGSDEIEEYRLSRIRSEE